MSKVNAHAEDFLEYYVTLPTSPQYAVLLTANWGAGKTWFIRDLISRKTSDDTRFLYVSLNGISSIKGVDREIFRQLHPVLGAKGVALAGKILSGVLKASLKIDLNDDESVTASPSSVLSDVNLPDYLRNTAGLILVFDDVERCSIPVLELLGYICDFVERDDRKVILVANESELRDNQLNLPHPVLYDRIKEKLIGKTLEVQPDVDAALTAFLSEITGSVAHELLLQNINLVRSTYEQGDFKNLRHLRQALLDLERLFRLLSGHALWKPGVAAELIRTFLIYSFEVKAGAIQARDIQTIKSGYFAQFLADQKKASAPEDLFKRLSKKYPGAYNGEPLVDGATWATILGGGVIDGAALEQSVTRSAYFADELAEPWTRLWHAIELPDEDVTRLVREVSSDLRRGAFHDLGVVLHVAGTLLWLQRIGVSPYSASAVKRHARAHINKLAARGQLDPAKTSLYGDHRWTGWGGLGFHENDNPDFQELAAFARFKLDAAATGLLPRQAKELLEKLSDEAEYFCRSIVLSNHADNRFYNIPILKYISPKEFVAAFMVLAPNRRLLVLRALEERYKGPSFRNELAAEAQWIETVRELFAAEKRRRRGRMSGHLATIAAEGTLQDALAALSVQAAV